MEEGGVLSSVLNLETMMGIASVGMSLFTARQERQHHLESKNLELKHHKIMMEMERRLHEEQMALDMKSVQADKRRHKESVRLSEDLHKQSARLEKSLHEAQLFSALEQHLQDITSDLIVAGKEADRDMWDQRNAQYQTLLLSATVMFAAGMAVIVEGELPTDSDMVVIIGYSASVGMAFAFLFVSIILCIRIVVSMSSFMYKLTNHHQTVVTNLVLKATDVMNQLFAIQEGENLPTTNNGQRAPGDRKSHRKHAHYDKLLDQLKIKRREINHYLARQYLTRRLLTEDRIEKHKKAFTKRMSQRNLRMEGKSTPGESNREIPYVERVLSAPVGVSRCGPDEEVPSMTEFEAFWHENLKTAARLSMLSFYVGTTMLLSGISFLIFARFTLTLKSPGGAYTFIAFVVVSLLLGLVVACLPRPKFDRNVMESNLERGDSKAEYLSRHRSPPAPQRMDSGRISVPGDNAHGVKRQ